MSGPLVRNHQTGFLLELDGFYDALKLAFDLPGFDIMNIQTHFVTHTGKSNARGGEMRRKTISVKYVLSHDWKGRLVLEQLPFHEDLF